MKKYFYYIGVQTLNGMRFVTGIDNRSKMCFWNPEKKPLALSLTLAKDLCEGLNLNGNIAVVVTSFYPLDAHFIHVD